MIAAPERNRLNLAENRLNTGRNWNVGKSLFEFEQECGHFEILRLWRRGRRKVWGAQ
jgi:hypothetical protein